MQSRVSSDDPQELGGISWLKIPNYCGWSYYQPLSNSQLASPLHTKEQLPLLHSQGYVLCILDGYAKDVSFIIFYG